MPSLSDTPVLSTTECGVSDRPRNHKVKDFQRHGIERVDRHVNDHLFCGFKTSLFDPECLLYYDMQEDYSVLSRPEHP